MGAPGNPLKDDRNRLSVCISGQVAMSILMNKLRKVPSLKLTALNTDSIQFEIDEDKVPIAEKILNAWQKRYRLELERDDTIKLVMRDINNYIEILETSKGKEVKFKGSCFASCPKIIIDENNKIMTKYEPNFKANSLAIVSEALAKYLLFDIPIEKTIMNENNIFKFQQVTHLGSTYEKCVQESPDGDILLQRNNRIYAGKKPSGKIIKVKYDGRRDSLANQPTNPVIDNKNVISIEDINKAWYIKLANQWANDFKGVKRLTEYKKDELLELALKKGLEVDKKVKKVDLIKLLEENDNVKTTSSRKSDSMTRTIDNKIGLKMGHITLMSYAYSKGRKSYWNCLCDCGRPCVKRYDTLLSSKYKACKKCVNKLRKVNCSSDCDTKNGSTYKRLYNIWVNMKRRCRDKKSDSYYHYGGKGRDVCDEWFNSYIVFKKWAIKNGYQDDLTLDRIDNNGDYCPENCRWATAAEQSRNTSRTRHLCYNNKEYCLSDLSKLTHIPRTSLHMYLAKYNNNAEKAINEYLKNKERRTK